jgi:hypothetical protein
MTAVSAATMADISAATASAATDVAAAAASAAATTAVATAPAVRPCVGGHWCDGKASGHQKRAEEAAPIRAEHSSCPRMHPGCVVRHERALGVTG